MAALGAGVGEGLPRDREKFPAVSRRRKGHFQDAVVVRSRLGVGGDHRRHEDALSSHADVELPDAGRIVPDACGCLGGEALVMVHLTVEHHVRSRGVQCIPQHLRLRGAGPARGGRGEEPGLVEQGHGAELLIRRQIGPEPQLLLRAHRIGHRGATVGVEHDDMPLAQVEAVVPLADGPRPVAEVVERALGARRPVIVIADHGTGAGEVPAPARMVAVLVLRPAAVGEGVVAQRRAR